MSDPVAVDAGLMAALRQKAKGERNSIGDVWGDHICADAANRIEALHAALQAAEERGAERMRDRAAKVANAEADAPLTYSCSVTARAIAAAIRALPLSETET